MNRERIKFLSFYNSEVKLLSNLKCFNMRNIEKRGQIRSGRNESGEAHFELYKELLKIILLRTDLDEQ